MTPDPHLLWQSIGDSVQALLHRLAESAAAIGGEAYLVGGPVRDLLREAGQLRDLDVMTTTDARAVAVIFAEVTRGRVEKTTEFGTATIGVNPAAGFSSLDLATARKETYPHPGALPVVSFPAPTVEDDLKRRDFTINAMALPLTPEGFGPLLDPFHGLDDLHAGMIRVLHDESFRDDPTRLFRGARYSARYRFTFAPETAVLAAVAVYNGALDTLSPARKRHEIALGMREHDAVRCLDRLQAYGLLRATSPTLVWDDWVAALVSRFASYGTTDNDDPGMLWPLWAAFVCRQGEEATTRLFADLAITETAIQAPVRLLVRAFRAWIAGAITRDSPNSVLAPYFEKLPEQVVSLFFPSLAPQLERFYTRLRAYQKGRHLDGNDLQRLGAPKGPAIGKLRAELRAAWLDKQIETLEDEEGFVRVRVTK